MIYTIFLQQLLYGIIALLITYVTGKLIVGFFKLEGNFFFRLFVTFIIGITSIVIVYSIIKAHGRTVNILLFPVIGYLLYFYRNSFTKKPTFNWKEIFVEFFWSLIPFLFVFFYQSWFYFDFRNGETYKLFCDFYSYADFSNSLKIWGAENYSTSLNFFNQELRSNLLPYHYPELWITAFFSIIFKISTIKSYYLVVFPILSSIYMIGIMQFFRSETNKFYVLVLSLILLFASSIYFTYPGQISIMGQQGMKLAYIYMLLMLSITLYIRNQKEIGLLILIYIPVFSITFLPGIIGGVIIATCFNTIITKGKKLKNELLIVCVCLFVSTSIFLFYRYFTIHLKIKEDLFFNNPIFNSLHAGLSFNAIKIASANLLYYSYSSFKMHSLSILLGFIPCIILFFKYHIKNFKLWSVYLCMILSGSVTSRLIYSNVNSFQFSTNLGAIGVIITIIVFIQFFNNSYYQKLKSFFYIGLYIMIIIIYSILPTIKDLNSYKLNNSDFTFLKEIKPTITNKQTIIMTFIKPDYNLAFGQTTTNEDIFSINQICDNDIIFTLGNPDLYLSKHKKLSNKDSTYYFNQIPINKWKQKGGNLYSFISKFKILNFYFSEGIEIPSFLMEKMDTLIYSKNLHYRFIKIKNK